MLLDSKGNPMESSQFRSSNVAAPALGPAYGNWSNDITWGQMPGAGILQFNLDLLTLTDYRSMRYNPQINSSLCLLTFLIAQCDWQIKCADAKIAQDLDDYIRPVWMKLVRAMSQAFWAGYSPIALEYDNNVNLGAITIKKFKDLIPEECEVKWDYISGSAVQFPGGIAPKFREYGGIRQYGANIIPVENCVHPDTKILCSDFTWKRAADLQVGQKILAFDEEDTHERAGKGGRQYKEAVVQVNNAGLKESVEIWTDIGDSITCTVDHPFLVRVAPTPRGGHAGRVVEGDGVTCPECYEKIMQSGRGAPRIFCSEICGVRFHKKKYVAQGTNYRPHWGWVNAEDLKVGDQIGFFGNPWEFEDSYEAGWMAGIIDGEGCLGKNGTLTISQRGGVVLDQIKSFLTNRQFGFTLNENDRDDCYDLFLLGGFREVMRLLATVRPKRMMDRALATLSEGIWLKINKSVSLATVCEKVSHVGVQPIASIQTSSGTLISAGYLSHNSLWFPFLMENGNYYGRKILKAAFAPWYFSTLLHLFANRYYERFGEPTIIGRAPFDDTFPMNDGSGKVISAKQAMENVVTSLRSRGTVVLPNTTQPINHLAATGMATKAVYDYDINFLESQMRGADFERYMARLDEEMSLAIFTPLLLMRSADVGSHNLGVQHTQCVAPETPILCADLVWRPASELKPLQEIVAFDDQPLVEGGKGVNARSYRTAFIIANLPGSKPSMQVSTDIGDPVTASVDHPWLIWRYRKAHESTSRSKGLVWCETKDLEVGDQIAYFGAPWKENGSRDAGWLAGIFDGEGSMSKNIANHGHEGRGIELTVSQNEGPVLDRIKHLLKEYGFAFSEAPYGTYKCHKLRLFGGFREAMRFLGVIRPERLLENCEWVWEDRGVRKGFTFDLATITEIEDIGENPVASIRTSTGTFITGGYLTHNTFLWILNALVGDAKDYIDKYVVNRLKEYNFGTNAPDAEWIPRPLGKENATLLQAAITALITTGAVSVDLVELGKAIGLTLHEANTIVAPTGSPTATVPEPSSPGRDQLPRNGENASASQRPRGVGEARATGRQVSHRVAAQVEKAWREGRFGPELTLSLGYRQRMVQVYRSEGLAADEAESITTQLYEKIERCAADALDLGTSAFSSPRDFMGLFDRILDNAIEESSR